MKSLFRESLNLSLVLFFMLTGAPSVRAGEPTPPLIVSVGDSVRVTGQITVEVDPPPIGYPGPIMTNIEPRMFERRTPGTALRPIRMLLLLMHGAVTPAPRTRTTYRVAVAGRYSRLLGADSILVTSWIVESELPVPSGSDRLRREQFRELHAGRQASQLWHATCFAHD